MLIVLSPAKRLDFESPIPEVPHTRASMLKDAAGLVSLLRAYSPAELGALMQVSDALAALNVARFREYRTPTRAPAARQAILAFAGDVYDGLGANELDAGGLAWAQDHLRILSGLYGVLRPLDLIRPYRLEMGTRLPNARGDSLYAFWADRIARALRRALAASGERIVVNLASEEYFRSVERPALGATVIQPVFEQWHGGAWKVISFNAKRARGAMARYAIDLRIDRSDALKSFDRDGYAYVERASGAHRWVFRRR